MRSQDTAGFRPRTFAGTADEYLARGRRDGKDDFQLWRRS